MFAVAFVAILAVSATMPSASAQGDAPPSRSTSPRADAVWADEPPLPAPAPARVVVDTSASMLTPRSGESVSVIVTVRNPSILVPLTVRVAVEGVPADWRVEPASANVTLWPTVHAPLEFVVTAPPHQGATAVLEFTARAPGGGLLGARAVPARAGGDVVDLEFGRDYGRPLADESFGSFLQTIGVHNPTSETLDVRLDAVALVADGFRFELGEDEFVLAPGGSAETAVRVLTPRPPAEQHGAVHLVFVATDVASGRESVYVEPYFWSTFSANAPVEPTLPWHADERIVAALAAAVLVGAAAVGASARAARRGLEPPFRFLAPLVGLFTRLRKPRALDHETRERLHRLIVESPGVTLAALRKAVPVAPGTVSHHLGALERLELVRSRREGPHRRYYPAGPRLPSAADVVTDAERRILDLLAREPLTQRELAERLGVTKQGVNYHVKRLERRGRLALVSVGGEWRCVARAPSVGTAPENEDGSGL